MNVYETDTNFVERSTFKEEMLLLGLTWCLFTCEHSMLSLVLEEMYDLLHA